MKRIISRVTQAGVAVAMAVTLAGAVKAQASDQYSQVRYSVETERAVTTAMSGIPVDCGWTDRDQSGDTFRVRVAELTATQIAAIQAAGGIVTETEPGVCDQAVPRTLPQPWPVTIGCQVNVAVGDISVEAIRAITRAGGSVTIEDVGDHAQPDGAVYQLTVRGWSLFEDDPRWDDLRDFEVECRAALPVISR